ncbi:flagellar hook basal-body protein [bacterium]|nr:flagellar hook basal-body protein [bacterium]
MILLGFAAATNGMQALLDQNDSTANNIANVNTIGFKRERMSFKNIYDESVMQKLYDGTNDSKKVGTLSVGSKVQKLTYDFTQGILNRTECPFDLAIEGDGFFKVQTPKGDIAYTRNGSLALDSKNFLINKEGDYILDQKSRKIKILTQGLRMHSSKDIMITEDGQIQINNEINPLRYQQKIGIFDFANKEEMIAIGGAKYVPTAVNKNKEMVPKKFTIQQGVLELSNTNIVREMINTINTSRSYEALSQNIKVANETLGEALKVGRIS